MYKYSILILVNFIIGTIFESSTLDMFWSELRTTFGLSCFRKEKQPQDTSYEVKMLYIVLKEKAGGIIYLKDTKGQITFTPKVPLQHPIVPPAEIIFNLTGADWILVGPTFRL